MSDKIKSTRFYWGTNSPGLFSSTCSGIKIWWYDSTIQHPDHPFPPIHVINYSMTLAMILPNSAQFKIQLHNINMSITCKSCKGSMWIKNVTKSGKSPKGGGGQHQKIKKSKIRNLDFLIRGRLYFHFFPNVNVDLKCFSWIKIS